MRAPTFHPSRGRSDQAAAGGWQRDAKATRWRTERSASAVLYVKWGAPEEGRVPHKIAIGESGQQQRPLWIALRTQVGPLPRSEKCQEQTSGSWLDRMVSACTPPGEVLVFSPISAGSKEIGPAPAPALVVANGVPCNHRRASEGTMHTIHRFVAFALGLVFALALTPPPTLAQTWPQRTVRLIIPLHRAPART
jgi:hypothetical protein